MDLLPVNRIVQVALSDRDVGVTCDLSDLVDGDTICMDSSQVTMPESMRPEALAQDLLSETVDLCGDILTAIAGIGF